MYNFKKNNLQILENDRRPVVAGKFYPSSANELKKDLESIFSESPSYHVEEPLQAIIVPHAGYIFSGHVAGSAYKALQKFDNPVNIFLIGSSHSMNFGGASIYNKGDYITPLGKVKVNRELANQLFKMNENITFFPEAHKTEHTIEVQLPFLQMLYGEDLQIIPIIIGTNNKAVIKSVAHTLKNFLKKENLFIVSSDFSHYPSYHDATKSDGMIAKSILSNDPETFIQSKLRVEGMNFDNLVTSICGSSAILTLLYMTEKSNYNYKLFDYKNSGDHVYFGDKTRVVGYWSIGVTKPRDVFHITSDERNALLSIARRTLQKYIANKDVDPLENIELTNALQKPVGAFVSVYTNGKLRGCIGRFNPDYPLYRIVQKMAIAAATADNRFSPVHADELAYTEIEISVLTPLDKVHDIKEIKLGKHGVYIRQDNKAGTLLPQVAIKNNWTLEEFLGRCARDKAGIGWDGWRRAEIFKYEAIIFKG
ncbi:AmmeMemoRadiSam system protein B [Saccharicrinis sp. FJH54]|uniref:AmmeMemoRadiSam system protein B n=1 Tax=Saccharicrinis sp. FJH54 TaxID=3344665 RepID=UPI0035D45496